MARYNTSLENRFLPVDLTHLVLLLGLIMKINLKAQKFDVVPVF